MKKILSTLIVALGIVSYSHAQGTVAVYNIGGANGNFTNTATSIYNGGTQAGGVSGLTSTAANGFYYALLFSPYGGAAPSANPSAGEWSVAMMATNYLVAGGIRGSGGSGGAAISGWAGGVTNYITLVGWSASLGSTWAAVQNQVISGNWVANGFFGVSPVGYIAAATSPAPATSIFGGNGLTSGITMYSVSPAAVPEPSTLVLAGLGGLSLLAFRRKK